MFKPLTRLVHLGKFTSVTLFCLTLIVVHSSRKNKRTCDSESPLSTSEYDGPIPQLDHGKDTINRKQLLSKQSKNSDIVQLNKSAFPSKEATNVRECFYNKYDILLRKL